jgi:hypothetical protein
MAGTYGLCTVLNSEAHQGVCQPPFLWYKKNAGTALLYLGFFRPIMRTPLVILASLLVQSSKVSWAQKTSWNHIQSTFGDAAFQGRPFSQPCYEDWDSVECTAVRESYTQATPRSNNSGAYVHTQWETCQTSAEQCLLDYTNPNNRDAVQVKDCAQGSVPSYFVLRFSLLSCKNP